MNIKEKLKRIGKVVGQVMSGAGLGIAVGVGILVAGEGVSRVVEARREAKREAQRVTRAVEDRIRQGAGYAAQLATTLTDEQKELLYPAPELMQYMHDRLKHVVSIVQDKEKDLIHTGKIEVWNYNDKIKVQFEDGSAITRSVQPVPEKARKAAQAFMPESTEDGGVRMYFTGRGVKEVVVCELWVFNDQNRMSLKSTFQGTKEALYNPYSAEVGGLRMAISKGKERACVEGTPDEAYLTVDNNPLIRADNWHEIMASRSPKPEKSQSDVTELGKSSSEASRPDLRHRRLRQRLARISQSGRKAVEQANKRANEAVRNGQYTKDPKGYIKPSERVKPKIFVPDSRSSR